MNDKRNPSINRGDGETLDSYAGRTGELLSRIEWQSEGHRQWYTHKNPYGCWICELLQISRELHDEIMAFNGPVREGDPLDREDDEFYNYDEEPEQDDLNNTKSDEL